MLDFLTSDAPCEVVDDPARQEAERAWQQATAAVKELQPKYERWKRLINRPASMTIEELGFNEAELDEAYGSFPALAAQFHDLTKTERAARQAFDHAHAKAYRARKQWHEQRLREHERRLVDMISGDILSTVRDIRAIVDAASAEAIPVHIDATHFPDTPLRLGDFRQGGLEVVVEELRRLTR